MTSCRSRTGRLQTERAPAAAPRARLRCAAVPRVCSDGMVAAGHRLSGAAHVSLERGICPACGVAGLLLQRRHLRRRHLLALPQHPRLRPGARVGRAAADAGPGGHHGPLPCAGGRSGGPPVARPRPVALDGGHAGALAAGRMVARLVPLRVLVAVAGLLADGHLARGPCTAGRNLPVVRRAAGVRRRARDARLRVAARASGRSRGTGAAVAACAGRRAYRMDACQRCRGRGRRGPGRDPPGPEVARQQSRHHARALPVPDPAGPRHAADRVARGRGAGPGQQSRALSARDGACRAPLQSAQFFPQLRPPGRDHSGHRRC